MNLLSFQQNSSFDVSPLYSFWPAVRWSPPPQGPCGIKSQRPQPPAAAPESSPPAVPPRRAPAAGKIVSIARMVETEQGISPAAGRPSRHWYL